MSSRNGMRVAVNGYGVTGKRVADAMAKQNDMQLAGVVEIGADWRPRIATKRAAPLFGAPLEHTDAMCEAGLELAGTLENLLGQVDIVIDCAPKKVAARAAPGIGG